MTFSDNENQDQPEQPEQPQQPIPPQQPPQQPIPPQQPQYQQPPQQPQYQQPPQQPQYQQTMPPPGYDPYAAQRERIKRQRNKRLFTQGLVALILVLAVCDGNPVNAFVDNTPVGPVIDQVKNRLEQVTGADLGSSEQTTDKKVEDTKNIDAEDEAFKTPEENVVPSGAVASNIECTLDNTPYFSPLPFNDMNNGNIFPGIETIELLYILNTISPEAFRENTNETLYNNLITLFNPPDNQSEEEINAFMEQIDKPTGLFGVFNDDVNVTKFKIWINRELVGEFTNQNFKEQDEIQILYFNFETWENFIDEQELEQFSLSFDGLNFLYLVFPNLNFSSGTATEFSIQIGDNEGCWSDVVTNQFFYKTLIDHLNETIYGEVEELNNEEAEDDAQAEADAQAEDDDGFDSGFGGSGPLITLPNLIPNTLGQLNDLGDSLDVLRNLDLIDLDTCSPDETLPYISGGTLNPNQRYVVDTGDYVVLEVLRNSDGYVQGVDYVNQIPYIIPLFELIITDNCDIDLYLYTLLNSTSYHYLQTYENPTGGIGTKEFRESIVIEQFTAGPRVWAEMAEVDPNSECASFYDTFVGNGQYLRQVPLQVDAIFNEGSAKERKFRISWSPKAANLCPGIYKIYASVLDSSFNLVPPRLLTTLEFKVPIREVIEVILGP